MMINILTYILIATLFSFGWNNAFGEGQIFEKAGNWMEANLPEWLHKPLFSCPKCNSFHVFTAMYWLFWGDVWWVWLMGAIAASGLATIILNFQTKLKDIADVIEEQTEAMNEIVNLPEDDEL